MARDDSEHGPEELLVPKRQILSALLRSDALRSGDVAEALRRATEVSAKILDTERCSVWQFRDGHDQLYCADLYLRHTGEHEQGAMIEKRQAPSYFAALREERSIAAHDALGDPRTREFKDGYLVPHGISSMLDAPIFLRGELIGVVCHEHVGQARQWRPWEELIAATLADFVSMAFSAAEQVEQTRELERYRSHLEALVEERTERLQESEEAFRSLFAASPVALVLTKSADHTVFEANVRASELFGVSVEEARGMRAPDFWIDQDERNALLRAVERSGDVPQFEARLRQGSGQPFWADLSAKALSYRGETAVLVGIRDVSDQKAAEEALRRSRETLQTLFDAAPVPMVLTTLDGGIIRLCNERAADMFDTTASGMIGVQALSLYVDPAARSGFVEALRNRGRVDGFETRLKSFSGREFWVLLTAKTIYVDGEAAFMVGFSDLTVQKKNEDELRHLATTDALTGVHNRRRFLELASAELERADRYGHALSLAMLDVDFFKSINDRYGHGVGDETLRGVVQTAEAEIRRSDVFGRYGGEEFVLLLPETRAPQACAVLERIRSAVAARELATSQGQVQVTVSGGVVERAPKEALEDLLKRADEALYEAKSGGRNRVLFGS